MKEEPTLSKLRSNPIEKIVDDLVSKKVGGSSGPTAANIEEPAGHKVKEVVEAVLTQKLQ